MSSIVKAPFVKNWLRMLKPYNLSLKTGPRAEICKHNQLKGGPVEKVLLAEKVVLCYRDKKVSNRWKDFRPGSTVLLLDDGGGAELHWAGWRSVTGKTLDTSYMNRIR